jgi:hypothetical protein
MNDDFPYFIFLAGMAAGIGISLAVFIAILFLG